MTLLVSWETQPLRIQPSPSFFSPPLRSLRRCVLALNCLLIRVDSGMAFSFRVSRITFYFP